MHQHQKGEKETSLKVCSAPGGGRSFRSHGPEFPPQAKVSGLVYLEDVQVQFEDLVFSPWCPPEFPASLGRSFRPWPEFTATRAGVSGLGFGCNGYIFGGYKYPSSFLQQSA